MTFKDAYDIYLCNFSKNLRLQRVPFLPAILVLHQRYGVSLSIT